MELQWIEADKEPTMLEVSRPQGNSGAYYLNLRGYHQGQICMTLTGLKAYLNDNSVLQAEEILMVFETMPE